MLATGAILIASGCTGAKPGTPGAVTHSPTPAPPQHYAVSVDGTSSSVPLASDAFYPPILGVHPGDTVTFSEVWTGEIHTVTFGTLIDQASAAPASPSPSPARGSPSPSAGAAVPSLFPSGFPAGHGDAVASAAQPCFLDSGSPPLTGACPQVPQPDFSGSQSFYSSGWLSQGQSFSVTVSATTAPGIYHYLDLAHPTMQGEVVVVPPSTVVSTPVDVAEAGASDLAQAVAAQATAASEAAASNSTLAAGVTESGITATFVAALGPPSVTVTVGQSLAWDLYGQHALAIDPPPAAVGLLTRSADGSVHINTALTHNSGGALPPTGPLTHPVTVNGGSYGSTGFHNSGLLVSYPPGLVTYTLKFTAPGTYTLRCLVHPSMTETINVAQ